MTSRFLVPALAAALCSTAVGCLSSETGDPGPVVLCEVDEDCDSGETCDDGFCYGVPPATLSFAAVLQPPGDPSNLTGGPLLVPTEIPLLDMSADGQLLNIQFERPVTISGTVEIPCDVDNDPTRTCGAIEATIEARRASRIPGIPRFFRTFDTRLDENNNPELELNLPPSNCGDPDPISCGDSYQLIVIPRSGTMASILPDGGDPTPVEQLVPPQTFDIVAGESQSSVVLSVGDPADLKLVTGSISRAGTGEAGYEVKAFGRETGLSEPIRASTVAVTRDDGSFSMLVRTDLTQKFDFVFEPGDAVTDPRPTVTLHDELVLDIENRTVAHDIPQILMPDIPAPVAFTVPINGASTAGETSPIGGATVLFSTELDTADNTSNITATFATQVTTFATEEDGPIGEATAQLFAGTTYDVVVLPPADGEFAAKFDAQVQTGSANGTTAAIDLGRRNAVHGIMVNSDGVPIPGAPVTAQASPRFMFELSDPDPNSALDLIEIIGELGFSVVTESDGSFFMWLDGDLANQDAAYDIYIEPPLAADAPRWTFEDRGAPAESTFLGELVLPRAAYTFGTIIDAGGQGVPGAKLEVYEITSAEFCNNECTPAPILRGTFVADELGVVRPVVLPDPVSSSLRR